MAQKSRRTPGEFELIARFFRPLAAGETGALSLLDDAAVLAVPPGSRLIATADCLVAGVHFLENADPEDIASKILRVNLSDLAAMGAKPHWYLLAAAFPKTADADWIGRFARALAREQKIFGVALVGGDTVATPGPASFTVTALGLAKAGQALPRSGARAGDDIYVSGTVGDGALGLRILQRRLRLSAAHGRALTARYHRPTPRIALGRGLVGLAHAAIDVSDGLVADLGHICETSGVSAVLEATRVPLSPAVRAALDSRPALLADVLTGGDDYELVFTAPQALARRIGALARAARVPLTRIGRIVPAGKIAPRVQVVDAAGKPLKLGRTGWRHF